jgi:uncharacterized damage-inducible protein DinB
MFSASQLYRLRHQHETLRELVTGLTEAQLRTPVNPGKWSAQQNIAHLAAYQPVFLTRLKRIQSEDGPLFERYVADNDPPFLEAAQKDVPSLLAKTDTDRKAIKEFLLSLDDEAFGRTAIHPRYGKMDVTRWVEFFLLHEAHHLFTIFMLTADLRKNNDNNSSTSNIQPPTSN